MELPVQQFRTKAEQAYLDMFVAAEKALPGAGNKWVSDLRTKAIEAYGRLGLPHRRIEAWKYTDLPDISGLKAAGVEVISLAQALEQPPRWLKDVLGQVNPRADDPLLALNT